MKQTPPAPLPGTALVDASFVAARAQLLEVAAFLDRAERWNVRADYRVEALRAAAGILCDGQPGRARRILEALSDPGNEPVEKPGRPAAGAWNPAGA